jgi:radical SAM superfamily enzyme YgiQ (UPF0313 family)
MSYHAILFTDITHTVLSWKPLGAFKIASILRMLGYRCLVIDHFHTWSIAELKKILNLAIGKDTLMIGFHTTFFADTNVCSDDGKGKIFGRLDQNNAVCPQGAEFEEELIDYIKSQNPKIKMVVGGSNTNRQDFSNVRFDYTLVGYSENSIVWLIKHLEHGATLSRYVVNKHGIGVVDDRAAAGYDFEKDHMVWQQSDIMNARVLPIECARGCVFNCKFCRHAMRGRSKVDFVRGTESIVEELSRNYEEFGITHYMITDDTFNDNQQKLSQIREAMMSLPFKPTLWCYARLDLLSVRPERLDQMWDIGVRSMFFGVETLTERVGKIIQKGYNPKAQIRTVQEIKKRYGGHMQTHANFITGLPTETTQELKHTVRLLESGEMPVDTWSFNALVLAQDKGHNWNSELARNYADYGYRMAQPTQRIAYEHTNDWDPYALPWESDQMNYESARELTQEFNSRSFAMPNRLVGGDMGFGLLNYPEWSWERVKTSLYSELDWHQVTVSRGIFTLRYRQRLIQWVSQHKDSAVNSSRMIAEGTV